MTDVAEVIGKSEQEENKMWCLPCESTGESKPASRYCLDCDELLCQTCVDFHMKFKSTKGHKLLQCNREDDFKGAQLLSPYLYCPQHNDRPVEVKCDIHNTLCCLTCATINHKNCHSVSEIRQLAGGCKSDGKIDQLRSRIKGINACMEEIISVNGVCQNDFEMSNADIPRSLEQLKGNLMKLYDEIETAVLREMQKLHLEETIATGNREEKWKLKLNANADLLKMLNAIQEVGTDSQVYVTIHKVKETLAEMEQSLQDQGCQIVGQKLNLKIKQKLDDILKTEITEDLVVIESIQNQYQLSKTSSHMNHEDCEEITSSSDAIQDSLVDRNLVDSSLAESRSDDIGDRHPQEQDFDKRPPDCDFDRCPPSQDSFRHNRPQPPDDRFDRRPTPGDCFHDDRGPPGGSWRDRKKDRNRDFRDGPAVRDDRRDDLVDQRGGAWRDRVPPRDDRGPPPRASWRDREAARDKRFDNRDVRLDKEEMGRLQGERDGDREAPPRDVREIGAWRSRGGDRDDRRRGVGYRGRGDSWRDRGSRGPDCGPRDRDDRDFWRGPDRDGRSMSRGPERDDRAIRQGQSTDQDPVT